MSTMKYVEHSYPLYLDWEGETFTKQEVTESLCMDLGSMPPLIDLTWYENGDGIGGGPVPIDTIYVDLPSFAENGYDGPTWSITLSEMVGEFITMRSGCSGNALEDCQVHPDNRVGAEALRDKLRELADKIDRALPSIE